MFTLCCACFLFFSQSSCQTKRSCRILPLDSAIWFVCSSQPSFQSPRFSLNNHLHSLLRSLARHLFALVSAYSNKLLSLAFGLESKLSLASSELKRFQSESLVWAVVWVSIRKAEQICWLISAFLGLFHQSSSYLGRGRNLLTRAL